MRLSIVVPALDEADGIVATLAAIAPLRAEGHEVIVVDGGSRDTTVELARPLADRVIAAARGRALQMNAGAGVATGDVLLFLHADSRLPEVAAAAIAAALRRGFRWGRFDVAITGRPAILRVVAGAMNLRSRLSGIATGDQGMFVERTLFSAAGGFPPIPLMEDVALSRRLKREAGRGACLAPRILTSGRRWEKHGAWRTILAMWRLRLLYALGADPARLARAYQGPMDAPTLIVFAKDPVPGAVKTRLAATMGMVEAAAVYRELVERTLATAVAAREQGIVGDVEMRCSPDATRPAFVAWSRQFGVRVAPQCAGDLGTRMRDALFDALHRGSPALLIGTDAPAIDVDYLEQAAGALRTHDAVFGPAEDGGYVLVGLARPIDAFDGIAWSSAGVMAATRANLATLRVRWRELAPLWDVDTPVDFARWQAQRATATA